MVEYEKSHFDLQWRRKERLDSKAANLISLVGIIIGVYTAASSYLLEKSSASFGFYISSVLFVSGIILYLYAAYKGLKALRIREYSLGPNPRDFADRWANTKEEDTLIALMLALVKSSEQVSVASDEQARNLEVAHRSLILGLLLTFFFVLSLILTRVLTVIGNDSFNLIPILLNST